MSDVSRRDAVKLAAGLAVGVGTLGTGQVLGQDSKTVPADLDAVLRVEVTDKGFIKLVFETTGKGEQSFECTEYRYAVLDKDGVQIGRTRSTMAMASLGINVPVSRCRRTKSRRSRGASPARSDFLAAARLRTQSSAFETFQVPLDFTCSLGLNPAPLVRGLGCFAEFELFGMIIRRGNCGQVRQVICELVISKYQKTPWGTTCSAIAC